MTFAGRTSRSFTFAYGAPTTELNFKEYKIWISTTSPVTNGVWEHDDPNLDYKDYNNATSTTITGLQPDTEYFVNIWAYDYYGHKASGTQIGMWTEPAPRARTVQFPAGAYSGDGTSGQNADATNTFAAFDFKLAEDSVNIEQAYIIFESEYEAYSDGMADYTGYSLAFDACAEPCSADAATGAAGWKRTIPPSCPTTKTIPAPLICASCST